METKHRRKNISKKSFKKTFALLILLISALFIISILNPNGILSSINLSNSEAKLISEKFLDNLRLTPPSPIPTPTSISIYSLMPSAETSTENSPIAGILRVTDITSEREAYVGKEVKVEGKIYVRYYASARPCPDEMSNCNPQTQNPTLHLVNPDFPQGQYPRQGDIIDLYRLVSEGKYEPVSCKLPSLWTDEGADCGQYAPNADIVLKGVFVKDKAPDLTVGNSSGDLKVIRWRDIYFLAI